MKTANETLQRALSRLKPQDRNYLLESISLSDEAIIFGSFAYGCETSESDLDILLIGDGVPKKSKYLDLLWLPNRRLKLKTWLGSELASHIAKYGLWLKGNGYWKQDVVISKTAINKKKLKIMYALTHLYVKKSDLSLNSRTEIISKILLDLFRLSFLVDKAAVPPTLIIKDKLASELHNLDNIVFDLLGNVGKVLFDENMSDLNVNQVLNKIHQEKYMY